jgi:hypothetical protein
MIWFNTSKPIFFDMALGEKLFEEIGNIVAVKVMKVHPMEGVTTEITFTSDIKGEGKFPNGKNFGSGVMTRYPHGIIDGAFQGVFTAENGDQFMWWAHEKSKIVENDKIKGLTIVTGFSNSEKLSWMNNIIFALDAVGSTLSNDFKATAYEWK